MPRPALPQTIIDLFIALGEYEGPTPANCLFSTGAYNKAAYYPTGNQTATKSQQLVSYESATGLIRTLPDTVGLRWQTRVRQYAWFYVIVQPDATHSVYLVDAERACGQTEQVPQRLLAEMHGVRRSDLVAVVNGMYDTESHKPPR